MKITERTIKFLGKTICGDNDILPYKTGQELVDFFVELGANDQYGEGFPSRWKYTEDKIREFNNSEKLSLAIESSVDPRDLIGSGHIINNVINSINQYLKYDGFELKLEGAFFKIHDAKGIVVEPKTVQGLNHDFIHEQIKKCQSKIDQNDFNGAITNARSLVEAVFIEIIEKQTGKEVKNDGNLENLYKQVKKILKLTIDTKILPQTIIQILSGLDSITGGLAGVSNNSGDRHANKFKTKKHHAKLAVNSSMTLVEFLLDSMEYQDKAL